MCENKHYPRLKTPGHPFSSFLREGAITLDLGCSIAMRILYFCHTEICKKHKCFKTL